MKKIIFIFLIVLFKSIPAITQEKKGLYIDVGAATMVKKSLLALPSFLFFGNPTSTSNYVEVGKTLFDVVKNDLDVSAYFTFIDKNAFLEDLDKKGLKPVTTESNGFNFEPLKKIGSEFLVRAGYYLKQNSKVEFEAYLYHVPTSKLIFGNKYSGTRNNLRTLAHTFCNDLILQLTGKKGIYLTRLAVVSDRGGANFKELYTMDWDANESSVKKLTNYKSIVASPAWSFDAKKIAFSAFIFHPELKIRNLDLLVMDLNSGSTRSLSAQKGINSGAAFTPDNNNIFFTMSRSGEADLHKFALDTGKVIRITRGPLNAMNVEPSISADGKRIAFSSNRSGLAMIYVMDINGSNVTRLTFAGNFNASPSWSPDGKLITFAGYDRDQDNFDIFLMQSDGTNLIRLTGSAKRNSRRMANNEDPSFSPDGRHIVFSSDRTGTKQVYMVNLDGSDERRLTLDNFTYEKPRWSPYLE